jgi:prepilin-type N-terminal cleavage/methylation domain-containing protein
MSDQNGYTVVEMIVVVAIFGLMFALATIAGVGFTNSARLSKTASAFANSVSLARQEALGKYEQWRISFPAVSPGSEVVTSYTVESCVLPVASPGGLCSGPWMVQSQVTLEPAVGLKVPLTSGQPLPLYFDRTGLFLGSDTEIGVCNAMETASSDLICRPGSTGRLIKIHGFSGIVET